MIIILKQPGTRIGLKSKQLYIAQHGKRKTVAIKHVESIVVLTRSNITHDAQITCAQHGIPIFYCKNGRPIAATLPFAHHGFVLTRKSQFEAYSTIKGPELMRQIIVGALTNKIRILKYYARNRRRTNPKLAYKFMKNTEKIEQLHDSVLNLQITSNSLSNNNNNYNYNNNNNNNNNSNNNSNNITPLQKYRQQLMGYEGMGSKIYYKTIQAVFPEDLNFTHRNRRPPKDPVNAAISFGNHLLSNEVMTAIVSAGLEPFAGFLHGDRSGRPSLVYDLMEEFRQPIVDRLLIRLFSRGILQNTDFQSKGSAAGVRFKDRALETFLGEFYFMIRKDGLILKNFFTTYQKIILNQARYLVRYFMGKEKEYKPFLFKW